MPDPRELRDGHYTPLDNARLVPREEFDGESHERHGVGPPPTRLGGQQAGRLTGADPADTPPAGPDDNPDGD